jgi:hypothetical protein
MRIEIIPLIIGALVGLLGLGILFDAWSPDDAAVTTERRRRPRVERHRSGEALIGFGVLALAGALIGRDSWRFSTLVVMIGAAFLVLGAILNRAYLREAFSNRGPLRRREAAEAETEKALEHRETISRSAAMMDRPSVRDVERAADAAPGAADRSSKATDAYTGVERRSHPRGPRR